MFQSDTNMFLAYLLPTVRILRSKLVALKDTETACKPLVTAVVDGIDQRLTSAYDDPETTAAAIIHPKFRTGWCSHSGIIDRGVQHIRDMMGLLQQQNEIDGNNSGDDENEDQIPKFVVFQTISTIKDEKSAAKFHYIKTITD